MDKFYLYNIDVLTALNDINRQAFATIDDRKTEYNYVVNAVKFFELKEYGL